VVVPNSLDENAILLAPACREPIVGFIGTYSYTPNLQAAQFLAERVFSHVLTEFPHAVLRLAGAHMPEDAVAKLGALKGIEVLGRVADSGRFMDGCAVLALPVFIRGGVPLKLIEAMARAKAVVASPELVEGLALVDGKDVLIRSKPDDFARAIVQLLRDARQREKLGAAARATFEREFSIASAEAMLRRDSLLAQPSGA
jgi:glycosyltransferase involved in cell wall biosynthesis